MKIKGADESLNGSTQNWKHLKILVLKSCKEFPVIGENFHVVVPRLEVKFE